MANTKMNGENMNGEQGEKMEGAITKNNSRIIIGLLVVICLLLVCNLGSSGYLVYLFQQSSNDGNASTSEVLPDDLSSEKDRTLLFDNFVSNFNEKDNEGIITLLDPLAQEEFSTEKMDQQLSLLYQIAGNIDGGTYSHYEYSGMNRGRDWFVLYYRIQTDNGVGTLTITIAQENQDAFEIWGFNIHVGS